MRDVTDLDPNSGGREPGPIELADQLDDLVRDHGYFPDDCTPVSVSHRVLTRIESINMCGKRQVTEVYHNLEPRIPYQRHDAN